MTLNELAETAGIVASIATCVAVIVAVLTLQAQARLNRQSKAVDIVSNCIAKFDAIYMDKLLLDLSASAEVEMRMRAGHWYDRYWDLVATEFEYASADFLPYELFERWFVMCLRSYTSGKAVGGIVPSIGWVEHGRPGVSLISPPFAQLVESALEMDEASAVAALKSAIAKRRGNGIFRAL